MSAAIPIVIRLLSLFGFRLSPFAGGAIVAGGIMLAIVGTGLAVYAKGYRAAETKCEAAALQSKIDALERDADIARSALADARLRSATIQLQAEAEQRGTANYVEQLKAHYSSACAINDDDLRGMRIERGEAPGSAEKGAAAGGRLLDAAGRAAARLKGR